MAQLVDAIVMVTTGGTAVQFASSGVFEWIYVMAHDDNTGVCHVGASTVVSAVDGTARGIQVPEAASGAERALFIQGPLDYADLYVDAATNGDSITYFAKNR